MRDVTLVFVFNPAWQILLCTKKMSDSWFTMALDKRNGAGGKIEEGESPEQWAIRELEEETHIVAQISDLQKVWVIDFTFAARPDWNQRMHIFVIKDCKQEAVETEEMRPQRRDPTALPYNQMREDDQYWLPRVLAGEYVEYVFWFDMEGKLDQTQKIK